VQQFVDRNLDGDHPISSTVYHHARGLAGPPCHRTGLSTGIVHWRPHPVQRDVPHLAALSVQRASVFVHS
jgi:hypothetical protein